MKGTVMDRDAFALLAELFTYPSEETEAKARRCVALLTHSDEKVAKLVDRFREFVEREGLEKLENIYTYTFDLTPSCPPYIGHYIFGEDYRRSYFMVGLKETYRRYGYSYDERELPDHIAVLLAFLPFYESEEERGELISLCLIPALKEMVKNLKDGNPYKALLEAVLLILGGGE